MPRSGLTSGRIIAQAAQLADEAGLEQLTLTAIARQCGISVPGLYKHVDGLDSIKRDIAVLAVRELSQVLAVATAGLSGREALRALAGAYRAYAAAHPGRYQASIRAPGAADTRHAQAGEQAMDIIQAALRKYGLDGPDLIHAIRMLRIACHGLASLEAEGGSALPHSLDVTFDRLINALDAEFRTHTER
jgi:AcrR family transcriptional regulator